VTRAAGVPSDDVSSDFEGLTPAPESSAGKQRPGLTPAERRQRRRLISAAVLGAVITAFALLNLDHVKVHWLVATGQTPLIVVIAFAFALGMLVDRLLIRAKRKRVANRPSTRSEIER
jgi:uncharacterized integral membrane protein